MPARSPARLSLILAVVLALFSGTASAANRTVITFPQPGTKIKSGLLMTLEICGIDANGYRAVRVEFKPLTGVALPADRQVRVVFTPHSYNSSLSPQVSQIVELPEGSTSVTATLAVPQCSQWWSGSIEVYENRRRLEDLSAERLGFAGANYWDWTEARPATLVIHSDMPARAVRERLAGAFKARGTDPSPTYLLPEVRGLTDLFPDPNRGGVAQTFVPGTRVSDATLLSQVADMPRLEMLPPAELPERWIELSQYDLIIVPLSDLKTLAATKEPARLKAIIDWASGGPLLIVYGVGDDFAGLAEIDRLLSLPRLPDDPATGAEFRGWQPAPQDKHQDRLLSDVEDFQASLVNPGQPYSGARQYYPTMPQRGASVYAPGQSGTLLPAPAKPPFAIRPIGLGRIVAIASEKPFPGKDDDWKWVLNSVPRRHWMWYQRNGYSLHRMNGDYWKFLIPGVGEAPVVSFLLLVSLFAVFIGPINYMFLDKSRRLYLLLITVPVGAALTTGGLFTYALVTDGLGVRVRARSFTEIDQQSGRAVAWSRQSYYAALAPSRGLSFPEDATVFPILYQPGTNRSSDQPSVKLAWDDGQHLTDGYIASRTAAQFMVLRTTDSADKLLVREGRSAGQPPQVTNQLQTNVTYLLLRDSRGEYWQGEKLAEGAAAGLNAVPVQDAADRLKKLFAHDEPQLPRGYDPNNPNAQHNNFLSLFMPDFGYYNVDVGSSLPLMADSLLEANLALATQPAKHALAAGTYVAVAESSPVVPYGVPRVREEASLHVIHGRY